jgi:hypothetical protein
MVLITQNLKIIRFYEVIIQHFSMELQGTADDKFRNHT